MGSVEHAERDREHQEEHQHALQMSCMVGGVLSPDAVQISLQPSCNAYVALRLTVIRERAIMEREGERRSKREKGKALHRCPHSLKSVDTLWRQSLQIKPLADLSLQSLAHLQLSSRVKVQSLPSLAFKPHQFCVFLAVISTEKGYRGTSEAQASCRHQQQKHSCHKPVCANFSQRHLLPLTKKLNLKSSSSDSSSLPLY